MQEAAQREIEEAMKKVKEAQSLITAAADSGKTVFMEVHFWCQVNFIFLDKVYFF